VLLLQWTLQAAGPAEETEKTQVVVMLRMLVRRRVCPLAACLDPDHQPQLYWEVEWLV